MGAMANSSWQFATNVYYYIEFYQKHIKNLKRRGAMVARATYDLTLSYTVGNYWLFLCGNKNQIAGG